LIDVQVEKTLGEFKVVATIADEKFICLTGRNGSGKSTLLQMIAGIIRPDEGYVKLNSRDITRIPIEQRRVVLVAPDSYIPNLSVEKHLTWGAKRRGVEVSDRYLTEVKQKLGINFSDTLRSDKLSLGMRARVSLASALISKPELILVDEAFSNLDNHEEFVLAYRELTTEERIDVIFSTQQKQDGDSLLSDHHYDMQEGKISKLK
jgi:molybdate/tungstate transport system ATP-binding protein